MYRIALVLGVIALFISLTPFAEAQQSANLEVQKVDSADPVSPNASFSYTITVINHGPNNANSTMLTDTLPAGVTFVSAPSCTFAAGVVTCDLGNIPNGQNRVRTINVTATAVNNTLLSNTASATSSIADPVPGDNSDTETTLVENLPVANNDSYSTNEDTTLNVPAPGVLSNDTDVNGDPLTAVLVSNASSGNVTLNSDGSFSYVPSGNFQGTDSFTYKANDGFGDSNVATVTITVNNVNDAPVANNDSYNVNEDATLTISAPGVLGNDNDLDGDSLTASLQTNVSNGTLSLNNDGSFTYTPNSDFHGSDSFTYVANDGTVNSNIATVTITVLPLNDAPTATDDAYSVDEDDTLTVAAPGVLSNDSDIDGDSLTAAMQSDVSNGTLSFNNDGSFTYTPDADFNGPDSFSYLANDGNADSNIVTVTITVNAVNDAPVASDESYNVNEDDVLSISTPGILSNDTDLENDSLTATIVDTTQNGSLTLNADGSFEYTPNSNFNGTDTFTYTASDGSDDSNVATVTITVDPINDAATAADDSYNVNEDDSLTIPANGVLSNDSDPDGDSLTVSLESNVSNGILTLNPDGSFGYTPNANFNGVDSFTYKASDGTVDSNVANVVITVNSTPDAPLAVDDTYNVDEDDTLTVSVPGILSNDSDIDGDSLAAVLQSDVSNGTLTLNANGSFTYTPDADFNGTDSFTYQASDSVLNSNTATVTITVNAVNDAPVANNDSYNVNENEVLTVPAVNGVLSNDTDVENDSLTASIVATTQNGSLTLNNDGSFTYTSDSNFNGSDSFTYMANDGNENSPEATVTINVGAVNDNPDAVDDSATTDQDVAVTVDVTANDSDIDGDSVSVTSVSDPANGTATNNNDGTVTYTPDSGFFGADSFTYTISDGNGGTDTATVSITVDEVIPPVTISINDTTVVEPLTGSTSASLTVSLSEAASTDVTVDFSTADGTSTADSDYSDDSGTVTIPAGETSATISIDILADADAFEGNETVLVNLSNPTGATINDNQGVITITETCLFCDDFEDNTMSTQWSYLKPAWSENNGTLIGAPTGRKAIALATPAFDGCTNCTFNTSVSSAGGDRNKVWVFAWYLDKKNRVELLMKEENDKWVLKHRSNGLVVAKAKGASTIMPNVLYNVEVAFDGTNFTLRVDGTLLITMPAGASVPSGTVGYQCRATTMSVGHIVVN